MGRYQGALGCGTSSLVHAGMCTRWGFPSCLFLWAAPHWPNSANPASGDSPNLSKGLELRDQDLPLCPASRLPLGSSAPQDLWAGSPETRHLLWTPLGLLALHSLVPDCISAGLTSVRCPGDPALPTLLKCRLQGQALVLFWRHSCTVGVNPTQVTATWPGLTLLHLKGEEPQSLSSCQPVQHHTVALEEEEQVAWDVPRDFLKAQPSQL